MSDEKSLQERYAPRGICFGCGAANEKGLRIRSFPAESGSESAAENEEVICEWRAEPHHQAFPGMLSGGIIGALLDCHSNWTAAYHLMKKNGKTEPDCTVTANYAVKLLRPTPFDAAIRLQARVVESSADRATVEAELIANDKVCATCTGLFVAVKEGHPAYHRW
jgi:acyl-coenzyme A thioesterase PaaI-like protein